MSSLLIDTEWYDRLGSTAYWEVEYERILWQERLTLFPSYHFINFRPTVHSDEGAAQADFALIDIRYREWWVVEVELAHHSLTNHVLPQVTTLARAQYGDQEADYLARMDTTLDRDRLHWMMRGQQPRVLVLVSSPVPQWASALRHLSVVIATIEVYRSRRNRHCLRIDGPLPHPPPDVITRCRPDPFVPRLLLIESPGALPPSPDGRYSLEMDGSVTLWERFSTRTQVWLTPARGNPLTAGAAYDILEREDGGLELAIQKPGGGQ